MKRLNPKTNLPFKQGDIREDGYLFFAYRLTKPIKKDGFFQEDWRSFISFKNHKTFKANWNKQDLEKNRIRTANWRKNNPTKKKCFDKNWYLKNKDKVNATTTKRRATKLNATPPWLTNDHKKQITKIYKSCSEISKQTGVQHHVDHIVPLKGKEVCGLHVPWNLQILTATENLSKNNRLVEH